MERIEQAIVCLVCHAIGGPAPFAAKFALIPFLRRTHVISFRPFRNSDPPQLAEIWRSQPASRGLAQPMTTALFERHVLNSPMFERQGLIVAIEGERLLGFVHTGFGPVAEGNRLDTTSGAICALLVRPLDAPGTLAAELLAQGEAYLKQQGASTVLAGGIHRLGPFYLGLIGGSTCLGILCSDPSQQNFFASHGYTESFRGSILQCDLSGFRQPIDRRLMGIRRRTQVVPVEDPDLHTWWEASTLGAVEHTRFNLVPREGGATLASVVAWDMERFGSTWGTRAAGLIELDVPLGPNRRQGLGLSVVSEALRYLQATGFMLAEAQVDTRSAGAKTLFEKLGFAEVDQAVQFSKAVG